MKIEGEVTCSLVRVVEGDRQGNPEEGVAAAEQWSEEFDAVVEYRCEVSRYKDGADADGNRWQWATDVEDLEILRITEDDGEGLAVVLEENLTPESLKRLLARLTEDAEERAAAEREDARSGYYGPDSRYDE